MSCWGVLEFDCVVELLSGMCEVLVCILGWVGVFSGHGTSVVRAMLWVGKKTCHSGVTLLFRICATFLRSWPLEGDRL